MAESGWLIELGSNPPRWWEGRPSALLGVRQADPFTPDAGQAIRFARREDAERAIGWLVQEGVREGCKATEHMWSMKPPSSLRKD